MMQVDIEAIKNGIRELVIADGDKKTSVVIGSTTKSGMMQKVILLSLASQAPSLEKTKAISIHDLDCCEYVNPTLLEGNVRGFGVNTRGYQNRPPKRLNK
jgi:hypothetical protein